MGFLRDALTVWKTLLIIVVPIVSLPILFIDGSQEMACLYGLVIMASMWISEALPIPVTALLPVLLFPILGVLPAKEVAASYIKDSAIFSFCCLTFALSIERWNLHRRIALASLLLIGSSPKWLLLGFMMPTWFLSMWVNNTSATAMMVPVVSAVLRQLAELRQSGLRPSIPHAESVDIKDSADEKDYIQEESAVGQDAWTSAFNNSSFRRLCKALSLCICYAATIGGTASLTGSSTNLVIQGQADEVFASYDLESDVNFFTWMMGCFPLSFTCLVIAWVWLVLHFFGFRELLSLSCGDEAETRATQGIIRRELSKLGPFTFAEKAVLLHFFMMLTLWLTLKMPGGFGWTYLFQQGFVTNTTSGIMVISSMFVFPSKTKSAATTRPEPLMTWRYVQEHFPWDTFMLLCGGFALAAICQKSGLSAWAGSHLSGVSGIQPWPLLLFLLALAMSFLTEVTSNAATASILGPIVAQLAISLQVNPLVLLYTTALSCSMAFMLPVATAPNAIVFATGYIKIKDMVKAGAALNVLCIITICLFVLSWFNIVLHLDYLPPQMRATVDVVNITNTTVNSTLGENFIVL